MELAQSRRSVGGAVPMREQPVFQARLAEAVALVRSARAWLHTAVQQNWESLLASGEVAFAERAELLLAETGAAVALCPVYGEKSQAVEAS